MVGALTHGHGNVLDVWNGIANPRSLFPGQDRTLILIAGKDYNHDSKDMAYTKDARSDTIMLLSVDLAHAKLNAVGIPRDTRVTAPDGVTGKINGTFQRGGIDLLRQTISSEFNVTPDHYVVLKADAVKALVDAVGGVEIEALDEMFYEDSWGGLKIDLPKGRYRINGSQAVGFVRFRKTGTHEIGPHGEKIPVHRPPSVEEGDIRRAERQQQLVHALVSEGLKPQNLLHADQLMDVAFSQIETDLSRTQVLALATIFKQSGSPNLSGTTIPGKDATIGKTYYWEPDVDRSRLTLDWILNGNEAAGRQLVRVAIYNATGKRGATKPVADNLEGAGFQVIRSGNAHEQTAQTEVVYRKATYEAFAREIAQAIGAKVVRKEPGDPRAYWLPEIKVTVASDLAPAAG